MSDLWILFLIFDTGNSFSCSLWKFPVCNQYLKIGKIFTGLMYKLLLSFKVISDVYMSLIPNTCITTFTKYFLLPRSFEIHWVRQYLVNFMVLVGIVNATVYRAEPIFTGDVSGIANYSNFEHCVMEQGIDLNYPGWMTNTLARNWTHKKTPMYPLHK